MLRTGQMARSGFVLIAVLGVIIGAGAISLIAMRSTKLVLLTSTNRVSLIRARWTAYGCIERARALFAESQVANVSGGDNWIRLDTVLASARLLDKSSSGCYWDAHPAGSRLDVNSADATTLRLLFSAVGVRAEQVDSLADALLDWRDHDDVPRTFGAEWRSYALVHKPVPRNAPLRSKREILLVRGFEALPSVTDLLDVEPNRPSLSRSPPALLLTLPGFSAELVSWLLERRRQGPLGADFTQAIGVLSDTARRVLLAAQGKLQGQLTLEPDSWILVSRARAGRALPIAAVEAKIGREGASTVVLRLREWWE